MTDFQFRLMDIDLSNGKHQLRIIDNDAIQRFIGGTGLAAWLLWTEGPGDGNPLDPEAPMLFMTGPLTGTAAASSGRHGIAGRSPLNGMWGEANVGGTWGSTLRKTGIDGIRIIGQSKEPSYLWISENGIEFRKAIHLWGKDTFETHEIIRNETHPKAVITCIGPAGEKCVRIASVMTDGHHARAAGRGGLGALMGSKNLKAVAVYGAKPLYISKREELLQDIKAMAKSLRESASRLTRSGTAGLVVPQEQLGSYPVKNYAQDHWPEGAQKTGWSALEKSIYVKNYRCSGCMIGCGRTVKTADGGTTGGPEYETLALFGGNLLIDDIALIQQMNEKCNRSGIDTMEAGSLIAFGMEAFEKGLLPANLREGFEPRWGDGPGAIELIDQMGENKGLGGFLARGYSEILKELPAEASEFAMHVKGMGFPAHDPRAYNSVALGYATSNRGACHLQGFTHAFERNLIEPTLGIDKIGDRFGTDKGRFVADLQNLMALFDSLSTCKLSLFGGVMIPHLASWFTMVTGIEMTGMDLLLAGERIYNMKRLLNVRWGLTPRMDSLPKRMLAQARKEGPSKGNVPPLDIMLEQYYAYRGWDRDTGAPDQKKRTQLGI